MAVVAAATATAALAIPASAEGGGPPVGDDGGALVGRIQEQMDTINSGSPGGGESKPPSCEWTERTDNGPPGPDPSDEVETHDNGTVRWVEPYLGHEEWQDSDVVDGTGGTVFRYECYHPDMEEADCVERDAAGDCMGQPIDENMCGMFLCRFPDVDPPNLALLAVDQFVRELPAPQPHFNPPGGTTYVNFDTWMWVEDVPGDGHISAPTMEVPGMTVNTSAELDNVNWAMGDGGTVDCPLTVDESSAEAECQYQYTRSSANQPNNTYTGQASTVWEATWTFEEQGVSGTVDAPRSTDFELQVAEVQTINR